MPHKRNPVLSENVTGLARTCGYAFPAMENVALWHERDISHSSVERMIGPDATGLLDFAMNRIDQGAGRTWWSTPKTDAENLEQTRGLPFSQRVLLTLIRRACPGTTPTNEYNRSR